MNNQPLQGKSVLVTRAASQAGELSRFIAELGGRPVEMPLIQTVLPRDEEAQEEIKRVFSNLSVFHWIIFTSPNGVRYFFRLWEEFYANLSFPPRLKWGAVGPKTADALRNKGITVDLMPEEYVAEDLLNAITSQIFDGSRILLPRGNLARGMLPRELQAKGYEIQELTVYETIMNEEKQDELLELLLQKKLDIITFTSSSTVTNFVMVIQQEWSKRFGNGVHPNWSTLLKDIKIACIGPITADTAKEHGFQVDAMADIYTIPGLVKALQLLA